jgi:hypothetical protein
MGCYNDEGKFETYAEGLAFICSSYGAICLMYGLPGIAHKVDELERENEVLRGSLDHIITQIDRLYSSIGWSSGFDHKTALGKIVDELDKETNERGRPQRRKYFKDKQPPDDDRHAKLFYQINVRPSLRLTKFIRHLLAPPQ